MICFCQCVYLNGTDRTFNERRLLRPCMSFTKTRFYCIFKILYEWNGIILKFKFCFLYYSLFLFDSQNVLKLFYYNFSYVCSLETLITCFLKFPKYMVLHVFKTHLNFLLITNTYFNVIFIFKLFFYILYFRKLRGFRA